jgi:transcriptional regulator with XRE-family HTH domain
VDDEWPKQVGVRLKAAREAAKLTQETALDALRDKVGMSLTVGSLSKAELGKHIPGADVIAGLARIYSTTSSELLGDAPKNETRLERDDDQPNAHFAAFVKLTNLDALGVTSAELAHVRRAPFRGGARSPLDYQRALLAILKIDELPQPEGFAEAKKRAKSTKR